MKSNETGGSIVYTNVTAQDYTNISGKMAEAFCEVPERKVRLWRRLLNWIKRG